jgi:O-antigen/teichoic acid export membrane protein
LLQDIKNTIKQSAIYGLSRISLKFVSFIITPIIAKYFTVSEYGVLDRFERFCQIIFAISLFGAETALLRWYTLITEESKKKSFIFTTLLFLIVINLFLIFIGNIFANQLSVLIFDSDIFHKVVAYTFLIACFEALMVIPLSILRAQNKPKLYLVITLSSTTIALLLQLYVLFNLPNKLEGIFISKFIAPAFIFITLLPFLVKNINLHFDTKLLREVINFSFPLMLTGVITTLLNSVNRFILGFVGQQDDVGLFSIASNISGIITFLLISPFQLAFNVIFWQKLKDENAGRFYTKSMTYSVFCYIWSAICLSLLIPYVIKIYIPTNTAYWKSTDLIPILSMSLVFYGMLTIAYMSYHHAKRNDLIFYFQTGALLLNIALNYLLIPNFRMFGAAFSTFISFGILIIIMYFYSKKFYFIKYESLKIFLMMVVGFLLIYSFSVFKIDVKILDITLRLLACILFPIILYFLRIYEQNEIYVFRNFIRKHFKINV